MAAHPDISNKSNVIAMPSRGMMHMTRAQYRAKVKQPTERELQSLRARLGRAAATGGLGRLEAIAYSDEVFLKLGRKSRKEAIALVMRIAGRTPKEPISRPPPTADSRMKIRWTDDLRARLASLAPGFPNSRQGARDLAAAMGLPPCCQGAIRMERCRQEKSRAYATKKARSARLSAQDDLPLAA